MVQPVEVMQKAMDVAATAERFMVLGDLEGATVLVAMADMYTSMARELRIGNLRMTTPRTRSGSVAAVTPVYADTLVRKTVNWDVKEPMPTPEPFAGSPSLTDELNGQPEEAAQRAEDGHTDPMQAVPAPDAPEPASTAEQSDELTDAEVASFTEAMAAPDATTVDAAAEFPPENPA